MAMGVTVTPGGGLSSVQSASRSVGSAGKPASTRIPTIIAIVLRHVARRRWRKVITFNRDEPYVP